MAVKIIIHSKNIQELNYRTLVVSSSESFRQSLTVKLQQHKFVPHLFTTTAEEANRMLLDQTFDAIIIENPVITESLIQLAVHNSLETGAGILIFTDIQFYEELAERLKKYGIIVLPSINAGQYIDITLNLMAATRERLRKMQKKTSTLEEKMNEIRVVNKAKWLLINTKHMTEDQAHKYIEQKAMNTCRPKLEVAEEIINSQDK